MAMFVQYEDENENGPIYREFQWHYGDTRNLNNIAWNYYGWVAIQADGDELGLIYNNLKFPVIPFKSVVSWFGDDARYILANL